MVKVHGNNVEIRDYRGNISMVHVIDVKKITLMEQVADEYEKLGKKGDSAKSVFHEATYQTSIGQQYTQARINPSSQDPTEDTTTPAAPTEVEGPPSSHLRSKTKQQPPSDKQGQPEHNPTTMDPPECNPAEIKVNSIEIAPKNYSWM